MKKNLLMSAVVAGLSMAVASAALANDKADAKGNGCKGENGCKGKGGCKGKKKKKKAAAADAAHGDAAHGDAAHGDAAKPAEGGAAH